MHRTNHAAKAVGRGLLMALVLVLAPTWEDESLLDDLVTVADSVVPVLTQSEQQSPAMRAMVQSITRQGGHVRGVIFTGLQKAA